MIADTGVAGLTDAFGVVAVWLRCRGHYEADCRLGLVQPWYGAVL